MKRTKFCLGPIETRLGAFLDFFGKTKIKAYTQMTVVMCSQIFDRKSVVSNNKKIWVPTGAPGGA